MEMKFSPFQEALACYQLFPSGFALTLIVGGIVGFAVGLYVPRKGDK